MPAASSFDPGEPEHVGRAVDADRLPRGAPEQLDHPAGAGADVDQAAERTDRRALGRSLRSTSLSATWSERIESQTSACDVK